MRCSTAFSASVVRYFLLSLSLALGSNSSYGISKILQPDVPASLRETEGAIIEENAVYFTFMTERAVRTLSKDKAEVSSRDEAGDANFIRDHRNANGDYWYWAHLRARQALVLALGRQPEEAIEVIDRIPYTDYLIPEYRWIVTLEFKEYLSKANEDLIYYYDPHLAVTVFFANYQVSQLEREYHNVTVARGAQKGRVIRAQVPIIEVNLRDLTATPRRGEEESVGLNALLRIEPNGITDSLLPTSDQYQERESRLQEKIISASDWNLKQIPVPTREIRETLEPYMEASRKFLRIEGKMTSDRELTTFSEDLRIVLNESSGLAELLTLHRKALGDADIITAK